MKMALTNIRGAKESGGFGKLLITEIDDVIKIWIGARGKDAL